MGSWKRTITTPFRKACTILSPQHGSASARTDDQHGSGSDGGKKTPRARHQLKRSGAAAAMARGGADDVAVDSPASTAQLYGDVMACAYEDVQVMWSMLDNKARVLDAAAS